MTTITPLTISNHLPQHPHNIPHLQHSSYWRALINSEAFSKHDGRRHGSPPSTLVLSVGFLLLFLAYAVYIRFFFIAHMTFCLPFAVVAPVGWAVRAFFLTRHFARVLYWEWLSRQCHTVVIVGLQFVYTGGFIVENFVALREKLYH